MAGGSANNDGGFASKGVGSANKASGSASKAGGSATKAGSGSANKAVLSAKALLKQELKEFVTSLHEQGILDHRFDELKELEDEHPGLVMEVLTTVIRDADSGMQELTTDLNEICFNFAKVSDIAHKIKGSTASVGGWRVAAACIQFREACSANNKEMCLATFVVMKREYLVLREKLNHIIGIEREIHEC